MLAEIARLDTAATAADPDGAGELTSGYDFDFREPRKVPSLAVVPIDPGSTDARVESTIIQIRVQVEPGFHEGLNQLFAGESPDSKIQLVAHFKDLEAASLVDLVNGEPAVRKNDRLVSIKRLNGDLVRTMRSPPGLYITEVTDIGHGLGIGSSGSYRNLLLLTLEERVQAAAG